MTRGAESGRVRSLKPGRSVFDLSYAKKLSGRMGYLYPVLHDEMVPGDVFDLSASAVIRFAPMVAPILHEIVLKADWFFVPYRILYDGKAFSTDGATPWEAFITGGHDGNDATVRYDLGILQLAQARTEGNLLDHLGIPPDVVLNDGTLSDAPLAFPAAAYVRIYNDYYRDPNFEGEIDIFPYFTNTDAPCLTCNWDADYFTRALPFQQRGTAPAFPVTGASTAVWDSSSFVGNVPVPGGVGSVYFNPAGGNPSISVDNTQSGYLQNALAFMNNNTIDLSPAITFNVADLRLSVQLQKWMERSARAGYRYTEFLKSHFGVAPRDDRLNRPEYIGGLRQNVVISEVLQTSMSPLDLADGTPQGNLSGHGILAGNHRIGRYHAQEFGVVMCLLSISPRPAYQQGIDRQWLRQSRYDFYHPEFANLSEQAITNEEIYLSPDVADNNGIFGYQGRYDEMRSKRDMVAGAFRSTLDYWHLGRQFASLPALGTTFGHVDPSSVTRCFAVPEADHLYIHWGNIIRAVRPLPMQSNPGLMDHEYGGM